MWFSQLKINEFVTNQYETIDEIYNKNDETGLLVCLNKTNFESQDINTYALISSN